MKGMHMIFNDINVNGRQIWETEHYDVKKNQTAVWNRPSSQWNTIFKNKNKKRLFFSHKLMLVLVNINGNWHIQNRFLL